jgi:hypothetical protein
MPEERYRHEKDEKEEKNEKGRDEKDQGGMEEKWRRDPISGIFTGLIVIGLGIMFLLASRDVIGWGEWWMYMLLVVGGVFILEALIRSFIPAYRRPIMGRVIVGLILIAVGFSNIYDIGTWWPLIIIVVGVVIIISVFFRHIKPK